MVGLDHLVACQHKQALVLHMVQAQEVGLLVGVITVRQPALSAYP
jgi:hypothetical protein